MCVRAERHYDTYEHVKKNKKERKERDKKKKTLKISGTRFWYGKYEIKPAVRASHQQIKGRREEQ